MVSVTSPLRTVLQSWGDWWKWVIRPCSPPRLITIRAPILPSARSIHPGRERLQEGWGHIGRGWTRSPCLASRHTSISVRDDLLMGPLGDLITPGFCGRRGTVLHVRMWKNLLSLYKMQTKKHFSGKFSTFLHFLSPGTFVTQAEAWMWMTSTFEKNWRQGGGVCVTAASHDCIFPTLFLSFHSGSLNSWFTLSYMMCSRRHHGERSTRTEEKGFWGNRPVQRLHQQLSSDVSSLFAASPSVLQKDWICSDTLS